MRLIDADILLKGKKDHEMISTHIIWNAPTVDAEPIKHGHWTKPYNNGYKQCSVCKQIHYGIPWNAEYCPFCGAKMDEAPL